MVRRCHGRRRAGRRDERRDGLLDLVRPLHHLRIDRQPVAQPEDAQLLDDVREVAGVGRRPVAPALSHPSLLILESLITAFT